MLLSTGYPLNKTNPKYCLKNECPRKALRIWLHYSFQNLTNGQFHLGLWIKVVVVVVVGNTREKAFDIELSQPHIAVPYKLSFQRNDWFPIVPEYRHKMALCSHLQYPLCNRVHCHSLSPCQTKLWNWSIAGSTKQWIAPELNKNTVHTRTRCPNSAVGTWKKGVFTSVPSKYRTLAPCLGAAQDFLGKMNLNTV